MVQEYLQARAEWDGESLKVTTGKVHRTWRLISDGLATTSYRRAAVADVSAGDRDSANRSGEWIRAGEARCDWSFRAVPRSASSVSVERVEMKVESGKLGTSDSLVVSFELLSAEANLGIRYRMYVYPSAEGVRTQISVRLLEDLPADEIPGSWENSIVERLGIVTDGIDRTAAGYYNDAQHRNHDDTPILKEEHRSGPIGRREIYDWANLLVITRETGRSEGIVLVKESPKCVNQAGLDTGAFILDPDGVRVTGMGLNNAAYAWYHPGGAHCLSTEYTDCWATWSVLFDGGADDAALALKRFDRIRFAPVPEADRFVRANTWGTRFVPGSGARDAATEENVRNEINSCVDLGIEHLTIDAGWDSPYPAGREGGEETPYHPHRERFPQGWGPIREYAAKRRVKLGLHFPVTTQLVDLLRNYEAGGFAMFKLDYGSYGTRRKLDAVLDTARALAAHAGASLRISWDLTENSPRTGYYVGREYGTIYPENRREIPIPRVTHVAYTPRLVLRDAWHFSKFLNLNQIEMAIQDPKRIDAAWSNASDYPVRYCTAIPLMAMPLFMMETQVFDEESRSQVRAVLAAYRKHRDAICDGFVFPVGDEPDDHGWTGFQSHDPETGTGYLFVFREAYNTSTRERISLRFVEDGEIDITDIEDGTTSRVAVKDGSIETEISRPADVRMLRYVPAKGEEPA